MTQTSGTELGARFLNFGGMSLSSLLISAPASLSVCPSATLPAAMTRIFVLLHITSHGIEIILIQVAHLSVQETNKKAKLLSLHYRNYHVFYYLLIGASEEERKEFRLLQPEEYFYLKQVRSHILKKNDITALKHKALGDGSFFRFLPASAHSKTLR